MPGAREDAGAACAARRRACYRDGDPRGPSWEELLEREIGSLLDAPDGINAVDAKELNRRLFLVAQRLADEVMGMHLTALLDPSVRQTLRQRLQSLYAVGMVAFLELPYYFAWSFQSRDRELQEQLRAYFLRGAAPHTPREGGGAVRRQAPAGVVRGEGGEGVGAPGEGSGRRLDVDLTLVTCSADTQPPTERAVDFRALAWRPSRDGSGPQLVVPPLVEIVDFLEEEEFTAVHTDSAAGQGLVALAAARLLHLPLTGVVDPEGLTAPRGPGDFAGRLRRRYRAWFYERLDEAFAPSRASARALVAAGVDPSRVTVVPPPDGHPAGRD